MNQPVKCPGSNLCIFNDSAKVKQMNELSAYSCRTDRDRILDAYFTCMSEQISDQCQCPSGKSSHVIGNTLNLIFRFNILC